MFDGTSDCTEALRFQNVARLVSNRTKVISILFEPQAQTRARWISLLHYHRQLLQTEDMDLSSVYTITTPYIPGTITGLQEREGVWYHIGKINYHWLSTQRLSYMCCMLQWKRTDSQVQRKKYSSARQAVAVKKRKFTFSLHVMKAIYSTPSYVFTCCLSVKR